MEDKAMDVDILAGIEDFEAFYKSYQTLSNRVNELTAENEKLSVEIKILKDRTTLSNSETIQGISARLQTTIDALNKQNKNYKPLVSQLKRKIRDLQQSIDQLKAQHMQDLCKIGIEKDRIVEELTKKQGVVTIHATQEESKDLSLVKAQVVSLQEKLNKQFEQADEKQHTYELNMQKVKDENMELRKMIRALEDEKFTHCPGSNVSSRGPSDMDFKTPALGKRNTKRKLFHPLNFTD